MSEGTKWIKLVISLVALVLVLLHLFVPGVSIDALTLGLFIAGILPWLSSLFKAVEFPGGWKVEFQELRDITKRAKEADLLVDNFDEQYSFELIAQQDPNLALAGLRIELEKRLSQLLGYEARGRNRGVGSLVRELAKEGKIDGRQASLLNDLIPLLNLAVHGADVDQSGSEWALGTGRRILNALKAKT